MGLIVVGIDPGLTGALAFIGCAGGVALEDMPTLDLPGDGLVKRRVDGRALADVVRRHCPADQAVAVFCEAVGTMGGRNNAVQTQGSLLRSLGAIEAVFDMLRWPCMPVLPQTWQAFYKLRGKKTETRARGEMPAAMKVARELYPQAAGNMARVGDHNRAEALLVAHWGWRYMA